MEYKTKVTMNSWMRRAGSTLLVTILFLSSCSSDVNQPSNTAIKVPKPALSLSTDSWIRIVPGRIIHFSPTSDDEKFQSYYIQDIETEVVLKEFQKPNYRLGLLRFDQKNQMEYTEIMDIFGDYFFGGKVLAQETDGKLTFTVNHADESGAKINIVDLNNYQQSNTIHFQVNKSSAQFMPTCSFLDESTGTRDMLCRSNGTHDESTYLMQKVGEKECWILNTLSLTDQSKPDPKLGPPLTEIDYRWPFVFWMHTTPTKEHYLFGNLTKNFGGKEVLKRYEHSPTNVEEEWVIEGGVDKTFPFMAKFSSDWNMEWAKRWTIPKDNVTMEEIVPIQNGYIISGVLPQRQGLWIGKINQSGEFEYLKTHFYADNQAFYSSKMVQDKAGNSYLVGKVKSIEWRGKNDNWENCGLTVNDEFAFIASFDLNGNVRYAKKHGVILHNNWDNVLPLSDGSLFLAGMLFNTYILAKTDTQGNLPLLGNFQESIQFLSHDLSVTFPTQPMMVHINPVTGRFDPIKTTSLPHELVKAQSHVPLHNVSKVTADGWFTPDLVPFPDNADLH